MGIGQQCDGLNRLAQTHLVTDDATHALLMQLPQPPNCHLLVLEQFCPQLPGHSKLVKHNILQPGLKILLLPQRIHILLIVILNGIQNHLFLRVSGTLSSLSCQALSPSRTRPSQVSLLVVHLIPVILRALAAQPFLLFLLAPGCLLLLLLINLLVFFIDLGILLLTIWPPLITTSRLLILPHLLSLPLLPLHFLHLRLHTQLPVGRQTQAHAACIIGHSSEWSHEPTLHQPVPALRIQGGICCLYLRLHAAAHTPKHTCHCIPLAACCHLCLQLLHVLIHLHHLVQPSLLCLQLLAPPLQIASVCSAERK
eukprot:comp22573_c4_seq4/m.34464 comp22573_c4_seq4/g.34464  ORF comp22573_c4_seq4/g.34464 comp22573_c4_seq4/m.34464 type:complete len:311 (+) comp22573_c4_seq4:1301-2233(+)